MREHFLRAASGGKHIVANGLVMNLDASDSNSYSGSGTTWTDLTNNGNNGTLVNNPTYSNTGNGSLLFQLNAYVQFNATQLAPGTNAFTWCFWCKLNDFSTFSILFSGSGSNTNYGVVALDPLASGLALYNNGFIIRDYNVSFSRLWWHIVYVGNGGSSGSRTLKLYRNATQAGNSASVDYNFTSPSPRVGSNHSTDFQPAQYKEHMRGYVSSVLYYNRALSDTEIMQNFNARRGIYGL